MDEPGQVDALGGQRRAGLLAERVAPTAPTNETSAPSRAAATAWFAALPAVMLREPAADDGLAGPGQARDRDDQVDVDRARRR